MNTIMSSPADLMEENNVGSDSDTNSDEDTRDYYQPISGVDVDGAGEEEEDYPLPINREDHRRSPSNGHCTLREAEDGISGIGLNGGEEDKEEEEMERESRELVIRRAFREDERRRRLPLTAENAARVVEAMRGVSFPGAAPDWASQVPEDRWIDHLRRLRQPS